MGRKLFANNVIAGLVILLMAGCAGPWEYDQSKSRARNIVEAGSIVDGDLYDSKDGITHA